jgi:hypothetical protein
MTGQAARRMDFRAVRGPPERRAVCLVWHKQSCEGPFVGISHVAAAPVEGLLVGAGGSVVFPVGAYLAAQN